MSYSLSTSDLSSLNPTFRTIGRETVPFSVLRVITPPCMTVPLSLEISLVRMTENEILALRLSRDPDDRSRSTR